MTRAATEPRRIRGENPLQTPEFRERLTGVLREHAGKAHAIKARALAHELGCLSRDQTEFALRQVIARLIDEGVPVASSSTGYFWLENDNELNEYIESLRTREEGLRVRREAVLKAWRDEQRAKAAGIHVQRIESTPSPTSDERAHEAMRRQPPPDYGRPRRKKKVAPQGQVSLF